MMKRLLFGRRALFATLVALLAVVWATSYYEVERHRQITLHEAETQAALTARIYAENTRSTFKRLNELLLDLRANWTGDWEKFTSVVKDRQENIKDIAFQIGVIDAEGYLAYSNLAPATTRIDLRDREHFRVHKERDSDHDALFISRPIKGRVSGKWTIQFTRPIWRGREFKGVIVASISPDTLSSFHSTLGLSEAGASSILRDSGEVMARFPHTDALVGQVVTWPYSAPSAPPEGHFQYVAQLDGIERIFGYYKLPDYGVSFFAAESLQVILAQHDDHRRTVILSAGTISLLLLGLFALLYRSVLARERMLGRLVISEQEQRLLGTAIDQSNASVVITDIEGTIVRVNSAFERITGYASSEAIGKNPRILKSGLNAPELYTVLWQTITSGKTWQGELQNRKKNGELYWESIIISPVSDAAGKITNFIAIKEDVSARKKQDVELRHAKEDAEAASIAKSQFLATMSHEIRTPMNGILGMAQLLRLPGVTEAEREEYSRTILDSGNTLQALLNDILDLSKVEAGKLTLIRSVFDPIRMLDDIVALFSNPVQRKGLQIEACWQSVPVHYWADPIRLRQMLSNLVSNAVKFTERGSITIEAGEVARDGNQARLRFSVTDTGIGIPEDKQDLLFQPFSQVDGSGTRRYAGTGLGLSIVRSLALLMQGATGVRSEPGKGSCFWFEIDAELVDEAAERAAGNGESAPALAQNAQALSIMLVEDNLINQRVIKAMLAKIGHRVECHENGQLALDALLAGARPRLVLMDCQMPVMDGFDATRAIRAWEQSQKLPATPIVALTAGAFQEDRELCLAVGMNDFLTKPADLNRLSAVISKWTTGPAAKE